MKYCYRTLCSALAMASPAMAVEALNSYVQVGNYPIDVSEASGITYNWNTDTLFGIGDEGEALVQFNKTGQFISSMAFDYNVSPRSARGLDDPEGVAYLGNNTFMIADERDHFGRVTTFEAGALRTQADLEPTSYDFDPNNSFADGNSGLEGVAYDPVDHAVWGIKETSPFTVLKMTGVPQVPGSTGPVTVTLPIIIRNITRWGNNYNFIQGSDIYVLASSAAFPAGHPRRMNVLLLSRNANRILEIDRAGNVVDTLSLLPLGQTTIEGITMDNEGVLYLVSENAGLHVLSPPVPPFNVKSSVMTFGEGGGIVAELSWDSVPGKSYLIEYSPDMHAEWQPVSETYLATGVTTFGTSSSMVNPGKGFFRIKKLATP